jgi:4-hydroxybenzoate polyprenyltransferase
MIKDLKDVEGDKVGNVKNIYTLFGKEKGNKITSVFLFLSLSSPILLYHEILDFFVLMPLAALAGFTFVKFESLNLVIVLTLPTFVYCLSRLIGLL